MMLKNCPQFVLILDLIEVLKVFSKVVSGFFQIVHFLVGPINRLRWKKNPQPNYTGRSDVSTLKFAREWNRITPESDNIILQVIWTFLNHSEPSKINWKWVDDYVVSWIRVPAPDGRPRGRIRRRCSWGRSCGERSRCWRRDWSAKAESRRWEWGQFKDFFQHHNISDFSTGSTFR